MHFGLLGPLEIRDDDDNLIELGGRQPRVMVAVLLLNAGRAVPVETIIDAVWGDAPPSSAAGTLQSYVSRLRRRLGPGSLVFESTGYRLVATPEQVDFLRFEALADRGSDLLERGDPEAARLALLEADALWRGTAFGDFADLEFAAATASRLELRRLTALEDRIEAELLLGRHTTVVDELASVVRAHPLRERLQAQLALAQYRAGRQADALRSIADAGRTLRDELGIEPGPELRELESRILAQDPSLEPRPPATRPGAHAATGAASGVATGTGSTAADPAAPVGIVPGRGSVPLVGRDGELAELVAALDASATSARFVVVEGEPGIGKTRLVDELRSIATARGAIAVWGRSDEGGAAPALWPWLVPLRVLAEHDDTLPDEVAELLRGQTPMSAGQAQSTQFDRFEAVAGWLTAISRRTPLLLLLDDLQWADATSLELLTYLAGRLDAGVTVVGTVRQLEVGRRDAVTDALAAIARRPGSRRLVLRGLSASDTATLLDVSATRAVDQSAAATIHARAEGNPFYAIELARLLDEEGGSRDVPGSVGDVIRRRLAGLPDDTTDLLRTAAVVGRDVDLTLLARTADADLDTVLDLLDPAVAHRLLVEVPDRPIELRFSHALVREVLLEDLTALRRARLHLRVADALEAAGAGTDEAEILAEHLWRAAPVGVGLRAADALERAAEVAQHRVAYAAAEDLLTKAAQLRRAAGSGRDDDLAELRTIRRLLEVARARRYFTTASPEHLARAKELASRWQLHDELLMLLWVEGAAYLPACRRDDVVPLIEGFAALADRDPRPIARAARHETIGVWHWSAGRIDDAVESLDLAWAALAEAPPESDPFLLEIGIVTTTFWLFMHAASGDLPLAEVLARFDALIDEADDDRFAVASICGFAGTTAIAHGAWEQATRYVELYDLADPAAQFAFWNGQSLMRRAITLATQGEVEAAVASFTDGLARYSAVGARSALATFHASLGMNLAAAGRLDLAEHWIAEARTALDRDQEGWNTTNVLIAEGKLAEHHGKVAEARARLVEAVGVATDQGAHAFAERARSLLAELDARSPQP